jgi:DNA-binding transcriptional LysR family regulator
VKLLPVAAPDHPLALNGKNVTCARREHIQLMLTDRSPLTQDQDLAVVEAQTWRLADLGSKRMLVKEGIGWGNIPQPMVRELDMPNCRGGLCDALLLDPECHRPTSSLDSKHCMALDRIARPS